MRGGTELLRHQSQSLIRERDIFSGLITHEPSNGKREQFRCLIIDNSQTTARGKHCVDRCAERSTRGSHCDDLVRIMRHAGRNRTASESKPTNECERRLRIVISIAHGEQERVATDIGLEHAFRCVECADRFARDQLSVDRLNRAHRHRSITTRRSHREIIHHKATLTKLIGRRRLHRGNKGFSVARHHRSCNPRLLDAKRNQILHNDKVSAIAFAQQTSRQPIVFDRVHARRAQHIKEI